ncbi:MAG: hypothetical protein PW788_15060 [Micavibrio sp.]|nr:hypothetical protein [Micavibrio sp.]
MREALRDKDTKYGWGDPGTGFTFDRQKNLINVDFMQSLIVGFEHARADVYREIGHSLLSVSYPKRMRDVNREMQPLLKKSRLAQQKKGPQLKPDEYKKLRMLSAEWQLRHMMFSAAEENVANKFVSNMGQQLLQDYSVSLNNTAVTNRGVGLTRIPQDGASEELKRYMNLCNAVQLSFFQNNGLFDNTDNGWFKVGVNPGLVRKTNTLASRPDDQKDDADGINHPDFQYLRELCGGPKGLENLQPKQHERLFGWANLTSRVERADADRKAIIEDIWRQYGEELIQKVLQQANDQIDQQLKEAQEKQQQQKDQQDQDGDDQDGQDQEGDDQDGQEQDGEGQGQGQGQGKGKGKKSKQEKNKEQQKKKDKRGKPQGEQDDADADEDGDDADGQDGQKGQKGQKGDKQKKDKGQKGDKGEKGEKQDGEGEDGEGQDADGEDADGQKGDKKEGKGKEGKLGADEEETVPVEGAGDMPAPEAGNDLPSEELDPNGNGQDADGEGKDADGEGQDADGEGDDADGEDADGDEGMTAEELEKELEKRQQEADEADGEGQDADGEGEDADGQGKGKKPGKGKPGKGSKQAGHGDGKSLEELSKLDWTDYQQRISELGGPITRVRKLFKDVQERQLQRKRTMSTGLDILPENGEVKDRFNADAHRNMTIKKATGQLEEGDLKRFNTDATKMVPTEIDIVIMIDGSGSMNGTPLLSALQASAIMFEAASGKDMKMNVYVGMWGDSDPPILIKPGADRIEIGKQMARAQKGLNSGTDLAPGIVKIAKTIGEQRGKSGTLSGFTHVLIISDGDMFDAEKAKANIMTMFEYSDKVTFDTAIIGNKNTNMEKMANGIKGRKSFQDVGVTVGRNPEEIPMSIVGLLLEKVKKTGSFVAVPNSQKRRAMKKAHNKMDPKP